MAHAISEMKQSEIELARRKRWIPKRKHMAHAISEMKQSEIELARRKR